jgi:type I restriction enzyme S subunit
MSKLQDLLDALCPNGVKYKSLSKLAGTITTGKLNANAMADDGAYPFFTCSIHDYRIDTYAFDCEALIIAGNGEVGETKYYNGKFNAYQRTYILYGFGEEVNVQFLYHYLRAFLKPHVIHLSKKGSIPYITLGMLEKFKIPVPPLPVQEEIVRILDTFTALEAELEAELSARRKQYEFYREQLLTFRLPASSQNAVEGAFSALQTDRQTDRRTE